MAGDGRRLGIYGFGAAAHIVAQVARWQGREVFAFTRAGDDDGAGIRPRPGRRLGRRFATMRRPSRSTPRIIFAPVGALVPAGARARCAKGGTVVCGGIHMSDIPAFPYDILWGEREVVSVANLTRRDGEEFLRIAPAGAGANGSRALSPGRGQRRRWRRCAGASLRGAAVLVPDTLVGAKT